MYFCFDINFRISKFKIQNDFTVFLNKDQMGKMFFLYVNLIFLNFRLKTFKKNVKDVFALMIDFLSSSLFRSTVKCDSYIFTSFEIRKRCLKSPAVVPASLLN